MPGLKKKAEPHFATAVQSPIVSIILPTYNRARFLPDAFEAIRTQQMTDWELIVVDDGSTDGTRAFVEEFARKVPQTVRYLHQENQGAYGARNTGLDHATGTYIAFYDSDDLWLPHHLADSVAALEANPEVDWVYGACRMVDYSSGRELAPNTFYVKGRARPFLQLKTRAEGRLHIIEDSGAARCQILHGLYCGLQNSVIQKRLFDNYRFAAELRNEAEDQVIVIWAAAEGFRFAYYDNVHVVYHVHDANSSLAGATKPLDKRLRLQMAAIQGFERLKSSGLARKSDQRELDRRLANEYFWHAGYALLWQDGRKQDALQMFRRGITLWPSNWRYWKTFILAVGRSRTPNALKNAIWWITDSKWRNVRKQIRQRITDYHNVQGRATREIVQKWGDRVMTGPFRDMKYVPAHVNPCCAHILLGTYEKELHDVVEFVCKAEYDTIIDIGVSEGYYLCGLAMRISASRLVGFEIDLTKHRGIQKLANSNGVMDRIILRGGCDAESLRRELDPNRRCLVICDVDGAETAILDPTAVPLLTKTDILVETHDLIRPGITTELLQLFADSHVTQRIDSQSRTIRDLPTDVDLGEIALDAMDEFRGGQQSWLWMQTKRDPVNADALTQPAGLSRVATV